MIITWLGQACFKIQAKDVTIVIDPYENIGLKLPRVTADLLLITHGHDDHANRKGVTGTPFVIDGPGEYEIKKVFVYGVSGYHDEDQGKSRGLVTMYRIECEGLTVAHLGDIGTSDLTQEQLEKLEDVDILMIPVGGVYTVDAKGAAKIVNHLEPRIVIPMHYQIQGLTLQKKLDTIDGFRKEMGGKGEILDKFRVMKRDVPQEDMQVVYLKPLP